MAAAPPSRRRWTSQDSIPARWAFERANRVGYFLSVMAGLHNRIPHFSLGAAMMLSLQQLATALGGEISGDQVLAPGPGHSPKDRSMCVKLGPDGYVVHSFAGDDWKDCRDLIDEKTGAAKWEPKRKSDPIANVNARPGKSDPPASYVYYTANRTPRLRVNRTQNRNPSFWQEHWDGSRFVKGGGDEPQLPYRLPELLAAEDLAVLIVEGEKDADNLTQLGFVATTNAGGAGNWQPELKQYFRGRDTFILPDNDEAGERHARKVYENLKGVTSEIRILRLPGLGDKEDVSDWLASGGTEDQLINLLSAAPRYEEATVEAEQSSKLIFSSGEFISGFVPPDYLIDGLIQRRFCYSLTAPTGTGKTAVALLLTAHIALGQAIGEYRVEQGSVLYLAGENPDDVRMRWLAMADAMGFDIDKINVHFLPGVYKLSEIGPRIKAEVEAIGPIDFLIVDTSAAFFEGQDENSNTQMGHHARRLRELVKLPGGPCVLVACHPVKNPSADNILPRGGGAFLAEVDGNLTLSKSDSVVTMHQQGKFRGPDFAPIPFMLSSATTPTLKDSRGRTIPTVIAKPLSERERSEAEASTRGDEDALLIAIAENERASMAGLATQLRWFTKDGKPYKARVQRAADRLKKGGYVKIERGALTLSEKGKKEAIRAKQDVDLAGSQCG